MGKTHYKWSFSIAMLVYQRVYPINIPLNHYKIPLNHKSSSISHPLDVRRSVRPRSRCPLANSRRARKSPGIQEAVDWGLFDAMSWYTNHDFPLYIYIILYIYYIYYIHIILYVYILGRILPIFSNTHPSFLGTTKSRGTRGKDVAIVVQGCWRIFAACCNSWLTKPRREPRSRRSGWKMDGKWMEHGHSWQDMVSLTHSRSGYDPWCWYILHDFG